MRKLTALFLAICMVCSLSVTLFAEETPAAAVEEQATTEHAPATPEEPEAAVEAAKGVEQTETLTLTSFELNGWDVQPPMRARAATGNYFGNQLKTADAKIVYDAIVNMLKTIDDVGGQPS